MFVADAGTTIVYKTCWYDPRFLLPSGDYTYRLAVRREDGLRVVPAVFEWVAERKCWQVVDLPHRVLTVGQVAYWCAEPKVLTQRYQVGSMAV